MDIILEKASNIEHSSNQQVTKSLLEEAIKLNAKREKSLRVSTITIRMSEEVTKESAIREIEHKWVTEREQIPPTFWQDKDFIYCQFFNTATKNDFLDMIKLTNSCPMLKDSIVGPNGDGIHFQRKPVRLEISNVRANIRTDIIKSTLEKLISAAAGVHEFKEGKPQAATRARTIYFRTSGNGFAQLFKENDGAIPYSNAATGTRTRLFIKINAKPWQCRECYKIGQHQCEGRLCGQCGNKGHNTHECRSVNKMCNNCKRKGHRAKDSHCPYFLNEVSKELRKMDIPIEFLEDKELRFLLIKHLQLK